MNHDKKAREYAARIRWLLDQARKDGFAFTVTGGRRTEYKLKVTVLPHTLDLDESADPETNPNQGD